MTPEEKTSYLQRRDGIVEILESLSPHWNLAAGLIVILTGAYVTPAIIDGIEEVLRKAIDDTEDAEEKQKIQNGLSRIEEMRKKEEKERQEEQAAVSNNSLENFII